MRIMHISRAAETLRWFMIPTFKAQQAMGHYVCICTSEEVDECIERDSLTDAQFLRSQGFDVFTHGLKRSLNPFGMIKAVLKIRSILRKHHIEAVICHNPLGAIMGRLAAFLARTPRVIYFAHGLSCAPHQSRLSWTIKYAIEKGLGQITDAILVMNNYDENLGKTRKIVRNAAKILRIPGMGVDLKKYSQEADINNRLSVCREQNFEPNAKLVIFVGRLIEEKGGGIFVASAVEVAQKHSDVNFLMAGQGPLYGVLKAKIEKEGLAARIKLLGWVQDVAKYVKAADIFVLPTYYIEGLPVSILEAMSCGKACIVTQHRGCEDAIEDGVSGFCVPVKNVGAVVEKLDLLLDNNELRLDMGRQARKRVEEVFALDKCTAIIVQKLEQALK